MYTRYQNLWRVFVANNNIREEYDDVALVWFFKSIQNRYSSNTLFYGCLNSRSIYKFIDDLKGLPRLHKFLTNQTKLYFTTKSNTFNAVEIDKILKTLWEDDKAKSTLQGVAIVFLYNGLLRGTKVSMITVKDVSIATVGLQHQIEVTFFHKRKRRNEGYQFFIASKFYLMFSRYVGEICQEWVAAGRHQILKKWNKFAKKRIQNTSNNNINNLHVVAC